MFVLASSPGSFCLVLKIVVGTFHHVFVKLEMRLHVHACVDNRQAVSYSLSVLTVPV